MNVLIMRHGDAQLQASVDAERPLSELGFLEAKVMAKWLTIENIKLDAIFVSPYIRAQQTAKTLVAALNIEKELQTLDNLVPEGSASFVHDYIDGVISPEQYENVLLVSHMPLVSYLCAELTVASDSPLFSTAAIAKIEYQSDLMSGRLVKLVSPDDFC